MKKKLASSTIFFCCFFIWSIAGAQDGDDNSNTELRRVTVTVNGNLLDPRTYVNAYAKNEDSDYVNFIPFGGNYFPGCILISPSDMDLISYGDSTLYFLKVVAWTYKKKFAEKDIFFFPINPIWFTGKGALIVDIILTKGKRGWSNDPNVGESWQGYPFKVVYHVDQFSISLEDGYVDPEDYPE